ncbi:response regulator [Aquidulcibacter sp.]|uniref:response regulator n=1 Tax=Aquidulcibacter sp. TaxID=2052990 RepID=UPI0025BB134D|nr:response regulator [Aquidulcibacter sp.]MCA3694479.1 response regulator [Aquidulcibacter sp.]
MSNYTCLLIEDSMIQARVISQMILRTGWVALVALDLRSGLAIMEEEPLELVISDLMLPDSTDGSTIAKIREAAPHVTIAAISAGGGRNSASALLERAKADGAEFLLQKPFSQERLQALLSEVSERLQSGTRRPHVLVIEPSRTLRKICETGLKEHDFRVTCGATLDEALDQIDILDLDAVVTQVDVTSDDGAELVRMMREAFPGVAIVAVSDKGESEIAKRAWLKTLEAGADVALAKPFTPEELVSSVRNGMVLAASAFLEAARRSA